MKKKIIPYILKNDKILQSLNSKMERVASPGSK
jgi:hypothetical protein